MYPPPAGPPPNMGAPPPHYREPPPPMPPPEVSASGAVGFAWGNMRADSGTWFTAAIFQLIPVIGPIALQGWHAEIMQRLVHRHPQPVPKLSFNDLMKYLNRGLPAFLVALVAGGIVGMLISLPMSCLGGVASAMLSSHRGYAGGGGDDGAALGVVAVMGLVGLFTMLVAFPAGMMIQGATLRAELTEDFGQSLKFGPIWDYVKRTWKTQLLAGFVFAFFAWLMALGGMLMCFVGIYAMVPVLQLGSMHLRYQTYQLHLSRGGEPIPTKMPEAPAAPPGGYAPTY